MTLNLCVQLWALGKFIRDDSVISVKLYSASFYAPNFEKVWENIGFGLSVYVCMYVSPFFRGMVLKLHVWIPRE